MAGAVNQVFPRSRTQRVSNQEDQSLIARTAFNAGLNRGRKIPPCGRGLVCLPVYRPGVRGSMST